MRIGSNDSPYKKIRVSLNPLDYLELKYRNPDGIQELRKLPGTRYSLDENGYPAQKRLNSPINAYVNRLFILNQALSIALMPDSRDDLSHEIRNFLVLNKDPRLPETTEQEVKKTKPEISLASNDSENFFDLSLLGSEMDMSEAAIACRDKLAQKRRDVNEFYVTRKFLFPLAMFGIQSADPAYTATILSAEDFGIKHTEPEIRLAAISILDETIKSVWFRFHEAQKHGTLQSSNNEGVLAMVTFEDLKGDLENLQTITRSLVQKDYGMFDDDFDVRNIATIAIQNSSKTQKVIKKYFEEQGYQVHNGSN